MAKIVDMQDYCNDSVQIQGMKGTICLKNR